MAPGARLQPSIYSYDGLRACAFPMLARTAAHLPVYTGSDTAPGAGRPVPPPNDLESAGTRRNRRFSRCGLFCHNCLTPYRVSGPSNTKIEKSKISPPPAESPPSSSAHPPPATGPPAPGAPENGGGTQTWVRFGLGTNMSRPCHSLTRHNPRAARATLSSESTRSSAGREAHGPTSPGARSQPNKLARTAMFVLARSRCSQSAGKVPTCEAACQRRWACTSRGDLLCHQRPGTDRRPDRRRLWRARAPMRRRSMARGIGVRAHPRSRGTQATD